MKIKDLAAERRKKSRFPMTRELRYKVQAEGKVVECGMGITLDAGSGGVAFLTEHELQPGSFIELSISWPVLLEDTCPMRLIVFGRVVRSAGRKAACTMDKHEFRTQGRAVRQTPVVRTDSMLQRWADSVRKENVKSVGA